MPDSSKHKAAILVAAETGTLVTEIRRALAGEDYHLHHAKHTPQAIEMLASPNPPVALAIVEVESLSGLDLLTHLIRQSPRTTKLIAVSGFFDDSFLQRLKAMGVDEVVQYPVNPQTWRKAILRLLHDGPDGHGRPIPPE